MTKILFGILIPAVAVLIGFAPINAYASYSEHGLFEYEQILVLPVDDVDWSQYREVVYIYYGDGIIIRTYEASPEELEMGLMLQQPHTNSAVDRERVLLPNITTHSIRNIRWSNTSWRWNPSEMWTRNSTGPGDVSVTWTTSETTTASRQVTLGVGVTDSVVSASIGASFTSSHAISTAHARQFNVPFRYEARVLVTFDRQRADFTCVRTHHIAFANPVETTAACSALGNPTNFVIDTERRRF